MTSRRKFISQLSAAAAAAGIAQLPFEVKASSEIVKLTVLHTNDVHSHIDPFPENDPKYPGLGGAANRFDLVTKVRNDNKNVLLLDAGDIFQGTPYFNLYKGELEMKLMSRTQYDAGTVGNHDFDLGIDGLVKQLPHTSFPLLNCNYEVKGTSLEGKFLPYKIFEKEDIRIGVFGVGIDLAGLVSENLWSGLSYTDPLQKAAVISHTLKHQKKCDLIICLSHLGYKYQDEKVSDVVLAQKSLNIDLIIGGHSHTLIEKPYEYRNRDGKKVLIGQVGFGGAYLGKIDFYFEKKSKKFLSSGTNVKVIDYARR